MLWSQKKMSKKGVARGQGQVTAKNLLPETIPDKLFARKWSNPVKLYRKVQVWYLFVRVFNCYWQSLSS